MAAACAFYRSLGFKLRYGDESAAFTSFVVGSSYLNLQLDRARPPVAGWGRAIFYVSDVDALYRVAAAIEPGPTTQPRDAEWGERYFHISDPDGHELSFARPLAGTPPPGP
ncbi:MAG: VOC family protein [Dehalococcoidia bacterium]|nr:VOC family protein [Dehalococcoidia bacterium]